jgi:hypothetical protein
MATSKNVSDSISDAEVATELRQLALVDRVIGLEAEVARLSISGPAAGGQRAEIERLQNDLAAVYASRTWRVGSLVLRPLRAVSGTGRKRNRA